VERAWFGHVFCLGAELNRGSFGGALCVQSVCEGRV